MSSHRRYVPHCHWRNSVAVLMAGITAGAWIPFVTDPHDATGPEDDEDGLSVPAPVFESHGPLTWPEQQVPRPPVSLTKRPKPVHNPAVDPTHARPTPKVPVKIRPVAPPPEHESVGSTLVAFARAQVGKRYVYGGNGPTVWDCSGMTRAAYGRVGVYLPRTSEDQSEVGTRVSLAALEPGDLVFWGIPGLAYHVGIYIGDSKIIAAQNPAVGVIEFTIAYYRPDFARRIF